MVDVLKNGLLPFLRAGGLAFPLLRPSPRVAGTSHTRCQSPALAQDHAQVYNLVYNLESAEAVRLWCHFQVI